MKEFYLKLYLTVMMLAAGVVAAAGQTSYKLNDLLSLGLRVMVVNTVDGEEPTFDKVSAPNGCMGQGITNATKVPGRVMIYNPDGTVSYDSEEYVAGESGMTIKVRGNTSAYESRTSFKIKLQKKGDLFCRGDKKYNDKNWALLVDNTMKHRNGMWMNELMGMDWTPAFEYINVLFNDVFRGTYLLVESVERNSDCRIDVSKTGFIVELDPYWWNENGQYVPSSFSPNFNYTFKYPDYEDMDESGLAYAAASMANLEKSLKDGSCEQFVDTESLACWILGHDILGTLDSGGSNMFFSKYDNTDESVIRCPMMWDFDTCERTDSTWSRTHTDMVYKIMFDPSVNRSFIEKYLDIWDHKGKYLCEEMLVRINDYQGSLESIAFDASIAKFNPRLPFSIECSERSIEWYSKRQQWLEEAMLELRNSLNPTGADFVEVMEAGDIILDGLKVFSDKGTPFSVFRADGTCVVASATSTITLPSAGMYFVVANGRSKKVMAKD